MVWRVVRWLLTFVGLSSLMMVTLAFKTQTFEPDPLLLAFGAGLGGFVTLCLMGMSWGEWTTTRKHQRFHDQDPSWNYVSVSGWTAAGYAAGVLFALLMASIGFALAVYGGDMSPMAGIVIGVFFVVLAMLNVPMMWFGWFSGWRWNETTLRRSDRVFGRHECQFSDVVSAGVWPVVGVLGVQLSDGTRFRISQDARGACGLYSRLRRELGQRFWGFSNKMDNELYALGMDREGRPLDDQTHP